ncbi:MAG TPA: hypothetical protein VKN76_00630 [Kiloniellaceae bacterium]|nr:hypothetical protein [Kiloniellaceae bacterium]
MRGDFWERVALEEGVYSDDPVEDFCVTLPQVMVDEGAVQSLLLYLRQWLAKPMSFTVDLSGSKGQKAKITFDGEGNSVLSAHHPTITFEGAAAGMPHLDVSFETDETCIRLFYQQLSRALEDLGY